MTRGHATGDNAARAQRTRRRLVLAGCGAGARPWGAGRWLWGAGIGSWGAGASAQPSAVPVAAGSEGAVSLNATSSFSSVTPGPDLPPGWQEQRIRSIEGNRFRLVAGQGQSLLQIQSSRSASSVLLRLAPDTRPARLAWRWRTDAWPTGVGAFGDKAGDDFSLRLYLMFDYPMDRVPVGQSLALRMARALYDPTLPAATLCYVADPRVPAGTLMASPYTSRVQVMVIRSAASPGAWWDEERDLRADFQRAFGAEYGPGMPPIAAVALAADTDQSGSRLTSWFSDLRWSTAR